MRLLALLRHCQLPSVAIVGVMLAVPANAQTGAESQTPSPVAPSSETELPSVGAKKEGSNILITIDKAEQKMTVSIEGVQQFEWPVSTGRFGYSTPSGTYTATSMNKIWYSKEWDNAPMPHAIFFMKDGHAIHGSYEVKSLGKPMSHGCVRISPQNATTLYGLVENYGLENTQVVLIGVTPGGDSNVEAQGPGWFDDDLPRGRSYARPPSRDSFFGFGP